MATNTRKAEQRIEYLKQDDAKVCNCKTAVQW